MAKTRLNICMDPEIYDKARESLPKGRSFSGLIETLVSNYLGNGKIVSDIDSWDCYLNNHPSKRKYLLTTYNQFIKDKRKEISDNKWSKWIDPVNNFLVEKPGEVFNDLKNKNLLHIIELTNDCYRLALDDLKIAKQLLDSLKTHGINYTIAKLTMEGLEPSNEYEELYMYNMQEIYIGIEKKTKE